MKTSGTGRFYMNELFDVGEWDDGILRFTFFHTQACIASEPFRIEGTPYDVCAANLDIWLTSVTTEVKVKLKRPIPWWIWA